MTRYTVTWTRVAEDQLAEIWMQASDRGAVNAAQNAIDDELAVDAEQKGTEVVEGLRELTIPPLKAFFEVEEMDRRVQVSALKRVP
ncbi:MAG: hypothetical protein L0Z62_14355 [Gemmataceae bacterium]|nr:hypothetical protein [Gemmataceae bacterium]